MTHDLDTPRKVLDAVERICSNVIINGNNRADEALDRICAIASRIPPEPAAGECQHNRASDGTPAGPVCNKPAVLCEEHGGHDGCARQVDTAAIAAHITLLLRSRLAPVRGIPQDHFARMVLSAVHSYMHGGKAIE